MEIPQILFIQLCIIQFSQQENFKTEVLKKSNVTRLCFAMKGEKDGEYKFTTWKICVILFVKLLNFPFLALSFAQLKNISSGVASALLQQSTRS